MGEALAWFGYLTAPLDGRRDAWVQLAMDLYMLRRASRRSRPRRWRRPRRSSPSLWRLLVISGIWRIVQVYLFFHGLFRRLLRAKVACKVYRYERLLLLPR